MKIIMFDLLSSQPQNGIKFHGGGEYIKSVFKEVVKHPIVDGKIHVCFNGDEFLDDWITSSIKKNDITVHYTKNAQDIVLIINELARDNEVRFFAGILYPYASYEFECNVISIGTCHGLRMLEKPFDTNAVAYAKTLRERMEVMKYGLFPKRMKHINKQMYIDAISKFDIIITDSFHSKYSMYLLLPDLMISKEAIVIYPMEKYLDIEVKDSVESEKFILIISANRWQKNARRGLLAIDELYNNCKLNGIKTKVFGDYPDKLKKELKYIDNFVFYEYASSAQLEQAYHDCDIFFYPTLNEGFGLPPMEAMKYGKTCVISSICSLPEVFGDAVYYCNPYDLVEMQTRLLLAIDNKIAMSTIKIRIDYLRMMQKKHAKILVEMIIGGSCL